MLPPMGEPEIAVTDLSQFRENRVGAGRPEPTMAGSLPAGTVTQPGAAGR